MAKIGTAHVEIKPVLNEEALAAICTEIESRVAAAIERATVEKVADWLGAHAMQRFQEHGSMDPRGAALYDAHAALLEGRGPR